MNKAPEANSFLTLCVALIGLTPAIMVLLPWDFGNDMNSYRGFMRGMSFTVTIVEMLILLIAVREGFRLIPAIIRLPMLTKTGLLLFWLIFLFSTVVVATQPIFALVGMAQLFLHLLFALSITHLISTQRDYFVRKLWPAIGFGIVGYALLWGVNIIFYDPRGTDWVSLVPALTNIRWIGFFALASFCAGLGALTTNSEGRIDRAKIGLPLLFLVLGLFLAIWTAARGAILAIMIATIVAAYSSKDWRTVAGLAFAAAIIASLIALASPDVHPIYGIESLWGSATQYRDINGLSSNRIQIWLETVRLIGTHPWAGWGIDQFRFSGPEVTLGIRHPHQSILQLLFAAGLSGVLALGFVVMPALQRLPIPLSSPPHMAAGSYLIAGTIYGLHDGFFYYTYPVMLYIVCAALLLKSPPPASASDRSD